MLLIAGRARRDVVEIDGSGYLCHARPRITGDLVSDRERWFEVVYLIGVATKTTSLREIDG
jgi:hypothetical protein